MIAVVAFGLVVLVLPAVVVLSGLSVVALAIASLVDADEPRAAHGMRAALISPRPDPA